MRENIKRFDSLADFKAWRAKDGWDYPNISYIDGPIEKSVHYTDEFIMRWYDNDTAKTPQFLGNISQTEFMNWVDNASSPCELAKDGSAFNYLLQTDYTQTATGFDGKTAKGSSHYNTDDKTSYLQLSEIKNVNVGLFQNSEEGYKEVRFNFDTGCPKGFHKWFAHPYWNSSIGAYTKLWGRYPITPITSTSSAGTEGINVAYGESMGTYNYTSDNIWGGTYEKRSWSANLMYAGINKTITSNSYKALEVTYWEHLVLSYIFCAYYKTFNVQSIFTGLQNNFASGYNGSWTNGGTDTLLSHKGGVTQTDTSNTAYRFMFIENPLYGQQWIWGAGWLGDNTTGTYYMTFDDYVANKAVTMSASDADVVGKYPTNVNGGYITKIDVFGVPTAVNGSSTSGFYDGLWSTNIYNSRIAYLGGTSDYGSLDGVFARDFRSDAGNQTWDRRGFVTVSR